MNEPQIAFSQKHIYELPSGHRFPISKYQLVYDQLVYEGVIQPFQVVDAGLCPEETILLAHGKDYWQNLKSYRLNEKEIRKIGLPINELSLARAQNSSQGTLFASEQALQSGLGLNLAGGTHHAYADHGEGFCILNDIAIAARFILNKKLVSKILVVDLDVHQGNGTAKIFEQQPEVFTFSLHGASNYPHHKEKSDLDIALPKGTGDEDYLQILNDNLKTTITTFKPEIIYYQAGVDVLDTDKLGTLNLSKKGCLLRDEMVIKACKSSNVPLVIVMGGGYSERLADIVDAHCNTYRMAIEHFY
jgi:acetoin utilization deacetylase AcuC-like enzyme